ncbi:MAG: hypothetical protein NTZ94_09965 [Verrucomicrobia bacterium]|nr:hypothetical protein [Verrucomicrobiota bacterium]
MAKAFRLLENDIDSLRRNSESASLALYEDPENKPLLPLTTELPLSSTREELDAQLLNIRGIILRLIESKIIDRISSNQLIHSRPIPIQSGRSFFWKIPDNSVPVGLKIKNPGPDTISNLTIALDGKKNPISIDEIVEVATAGKFGDEEKALGLWSYVVKNRCHDWPSSHSGNEAFDPVKLFSVYGYGFCSHAAKALAILANNAGFESRIRHVKGQHVVCEILIDEHWSMFDADGEVFYRTKEGKIASVDEVCEKPDLVYTQQSPVYSHAKLKEIYSNHKFITIPLEKFAHFTPHKILPKLRPGEELQFSLQKKGLFFVSRYLEVPREYANGSWNYKPVLTSEKNLPDGLALGNVLLSKVGDTHAFLVSDQSKEANISCGFDLPFPVLRAKVQVESFSDAVQKHNIQVLASRDGKSWINSHAAAPEGKDLLFAFDDFPNRIGGVPDYKFLLKIVMPPGHERKEFPKFYVELDLQLAPRSLPISGAKGGSLVLSYESNNNQELEVSFFHQAETIGRKNVAYGDSSKPYALNVQN